MALLTDTDLRKIIVDTPEKQGPNKLLIKPYYEGSLTPIGYDLKIGDRYASKINGIFDTKENKLVKINPSDTALIETLENITMPKDRSISAIILSKVSKVSKGLSHISTTIDPDWSGNLLIAITNHSTKKITLDYEEEFCTVVFFNNLSASTKPCNKPPNRSDILLQEWTITNKNAIRKRKLRKLSYFITIPVAFCIGYLLFENNAGLIATTAAGIAITQFLLSYLE